MLSPQHGSIYSPNHKSSRFSIQNSEVIKDDVIFQAADSKEQEKGILGPGYYYINTDSLNKHSFNIRARQSSERIGMIHPRNMSEIGSSFAGISRDHGTPASAKLVNSSASKQRAKSAPRFRG